MTAKCITIPQFQKKLKRVKAKHVKLANINRTLKQKKCQQNLEYILTESREFREKIDFHGNIIEQAEQAVQDLESLWAET